MTALLFTLALLTIPSWLLVAPTSRALRLRSRVLLWIAMQPGNGGLPRPRVWMAALDLARRANVLEATERDRRRLRRALAVMAAPPPRLREAPPSALLVYGTPGRAGPAARPWGWQPARTSSVYRSAVPALPRRAPLSYQWPAPRSAAPRIPPPPWPIDE